MARPKTSSLRKGVWFTAGLAAFVVVCLIAAYAGETVHTSPVSLPQQTPVVRGGHVSGDKVTQARRSAMASVEEVASAFKSAELSEEATQEVFSKQLQDLHTSRAVRIMQDTTGLIERPCAKNTKKHLNRNHGSTKCYYPAPPPVQQTPFNCSVCLSGSVSYYQTQTEAIAATQANVLLGTPSVCTQWKGLASSAFLSVADPTTSAFGFALAKDKTISCTVVNAGTLGYSVSQGPYCTSLDNVNSFAAILANLPSTSAAIQAKVDDIANQNGGYCPTQTNSDVTVDIKYSFAQLSEICAPDTVPSGYIDIATGCNVTTSR